MTLFISSDQVREIATPDLCLDAARRAIALSGQPETRVPPRMDLDHEFGFFRVMPATAGDYAGLKVMTLRKGVGNRYLIMLASKESGDIVAFVDADEITRLRTAATTVAAAEQVCRTPITDLGLIGTGFEAAGHLEAFAHRWQLERVTVFSRSEEKRHAFSEAMSEKLGVPVHAVADPAAAQAAHQVVVLATKSPTPVVDGRAFAMGACVLSIGATRPDLREIDSATFARAHHVVVDDAVQVQAESGDVMAGVSEGLIGPGDLVGAGDWDPETHQPHSGRDLIVFKSVGTAVQDLTLASAVVEQALQSHLGRDLGVLAGLKTAG